MSSLANLLPRNGRAGRTAPSRSTDTQRARFRTVMAGVATPVAIVTVVDSGRPHGTTVSAFMSLSLDPPMVLVALDRGSNLLRMIESAGRFGVNVLSTAQVALASTFAARGVSDRFDGVEWEHQGGVPRLAGSRGWLSCTVNEAVSAGDHIALLAHVDDCAEGKAEPLTYYARAFGTHRPVDS